MGKFHRGMYNMPRGHMYSEKAVERLVANKIESAIHDMELEMDAAWDDVMTWSC